MAEHLEQSEFDKRTQWKHNPWRARSEYVGLLGTGEHKASSAAQFCGLKVRE